MMKIITHSSNDKIPEALDDFNYTRFRDYVQRRSGLYFPEKKRSDLSVGVLNAMKSAGYTNIDEYYKELTIGEKRDQEFKNLVCFLTIKETYFFRHFEVVQKNILPELVSIKSNEKKLRIWSAGCCTGEEPYSIAIALKEILNDLTDWDILILATDIDIKALQHARDGVYRPWSLRSTDDYYRFKYFERDGENYRLDSEIKKMVNFQWLNLVENTYPSYATNTHEMDLVLCRNVTIYFELETTKKIVDKFYNSLLEHRVLMVGHSEPSSLVYDKFKAEIFPDAVVYRKDISIFEQKKAIPIIKTREYIPEATSLVVAQKQIVPEKPPVTISQSPTSQIISEEKKKEEERRANFNEAEAFDEGVKLFEKKEFEKALNVFKDIISVNPRNARAYYMIGHIHANKENYAEATQNCLKAIELDSLLLEAYYLLSVIYREELRYEEAVDLLKKVVYINSNFVLGYFELMCNYVRIKNKELAEKSYRQVQKLLKTKSPQEMVGGLDGFTAGELLSMADIWMKGN